MNNLKSKLKKQGGFTLIEMLIVVAIIAILIAIAIPMVNNALERSREATDAANERAAIGMAMVEVLGENKLGGTAIDPTKTSVDAYYKVTNNKGELVSLAAAPSTGSTGYNYGKGTGAGDVPDVNVNKGIKVTYYLKADGANKAGDFVVAWF